MLRTKIHPTVFVLLLVSVFCLVSLLFVQVARAEETSPEATTQTTQTAPVRRPLPFVNKIKTEVQNIRGEIQEKRVQVQDMRRDFHASSSEARKEIRVERQDMRKDLHASSTEVRKEIRNDRRELASSTREAHRNLQEEHRAAIKNEMVKRAQMQFDLIVKRLTTAIDRLDNISGRIDSRIAKLKADGINTATMESLQVTAKAKVDAADVAVRAITMPTLPTDSSASTTPQMINSALASTRFQVKATEDAIKEAQKALNAVVVEMKNKGGDKAEKEKEGEPAPQQ